MTFLLGVSFPFLIFALTVGQLSKTFDLAIQSLMDYNFVYFWTFIIWLPPTCTLLYFGVQNNAQMEPHRPYVPKTTISWF